MEHIRDWAPKLEELLGEDNPLEGVDPILDSRAWEGIRSLLGRSWWTRLWTVQEVALAREVTLMCGRKTLSWNCFLLWLSASHELGVLKFGRLRIRLTGTNGE
jgi:hypothetical protein